MASVQEIADGLVAMCKTGDFHGATEKYYGQDIVSTEPMGEPATVKGMDAIRGKMEWWNSTMEVHGVEVNGPWVNGSTFLVEYKIDATDKSKGTRSVMHEFGLYTVEGDKIVDEKFYYVGM